MNVDAVTLPTVDVSAAPPAKDMFRGRQSLRWKSENAALWICLFLAPLTIGLVAFVFHEQLAGSTIAVLIVVALAYTSMARGRLLGTSIRVHEAQLPRVFRIVESCAKSLGVPLPYIFVREDFQVPLVAVGLYEPYSLVISTNWLTHLKDDELTFLVGRELGHIYAGHTRLASLVSSSGRDNPIVAIVMGLWLRRTEYTADRVGLLCCDSSDAAIRAIFRTDFRPIADTIDYESFAAQRKDIETDPSLRLGEWIGREPYATHRVHELRTFATSGLYEHWRDHLTRWRERASRPTFQEVRAPWLGVAFFVDVIIVGAFANYLEATNKVTVTMDAQGARGTVTWLGAHAPWVRDLLGLSQTSSPADVADTFKWFICIVDALLLFAVIAIILRRTPGMFIFGIGRERKTAADKRKRPSNDAKKRSH